MEQRVRCIAVVGAGASAPLLGRGNELVKDLEREFAAEEELREEESYRLQRVYGLDPEDFETRIAALSRTPEITRHVREAISKRYVARHPTILGYELLAHLLKHRFLDAIVSFNFDELLDQSLDDELGQNAYRRLVSDRDCPGVVTNPDAPDYLPLYIKLHGTATEPDSLRLTREAYYKLSQQLMEVVGELFESQTTIVLNLGSAMTGFDLQRLLRIPERLEIFDLSLTPLEKPVQKAIRSERRAARPDSFHPDEDREKPDFFLPAEDLAEKKNEQWSCDEWLKQLTNAMGRRSGKGPKKQIDPNSLARLVDFRPVDRHEAVADVLGPAATLSRWLKDPEKHRAEYADYLRKRTIVELALSGAKARGLAQLSWLAIDRSGSYFELYRREGRTSELESWGSLRMASGLDENTSLPDVVESHPNLCESGARPTLDQGTWALREFIPDLLAKQVMTSVGRHGAAVKNRFSSTLRNLQKGSEVEIHATDDRVCVKAFDAPLTLPTLTALKVFTAALFNGIRAEDEVYISLRDRRVAAEKGGDYVRPPLETEGGQGSHRVRVQEGRSGTGIRRQAEAALAGPLAA